MKSLCVLYGFFLMYGILNAQDLSIGLTVNDLAAHPMQDAAKPAYLDTIIDPSFGTTIRRITDAGSGNGIVPMYSTIQAWNADESLMIVYDQTHGTHQLLNGMNYQFIRNLDDVDPDDVEQIFWDFHNPDLLYYPDNNSGSFIRYHVSSQIHDTIVSLDNLTRCTGSKSMGNDIQMMSWDSDVFSFRCENDSAYSYRISTGQLTAFDIAEIDWCAPTVAPSGTLFYHASRVYNSSGIPVRTLNESGVEHSCIGALPNGHDGYFTIAFSEGPLGGGLGNIIAHDLTTGHWFPVISESQGYDYPKSGTHISAVAHKNTEGGWIAASMIGYNQDGQSLLDQELVVAKTDEGSIKVCRIGHHRSDEDQFDYWGEPHACISPSGTRVLFGSDWSGSEDGQSLDCYVVELPSFDAPVSVHPAGTVLPPETFSLAQNYPNPFNPKTIIRYTVEVKRIVHLKIYDVLGREAAVLVNEEKNAGTYSVQWDASAFPSGVYFYCLQAGTNIQTRKLVVLK